MNYIEKEVLKRAKVLPGNVLKATSFLNHQLDPKLLDEMALSWYEEFKDSQVNKIITVESSGIALAILAGLKFNVPVVFAKKGESSNIGECYCEKVYSYTKQKEFIVRIEKELLNENDNVLVIDDFLADGNALRGLLSIIKSAGASCVGAGIAIEKGYQGGGDELRKEGLKLKSLAIIDSMEDKTGNIVFRK